MHACNPPDLLFATALWLRRTGTRFVFDHHDLSWEHSKQELLRAYDRALKGKNSAARRP